MSTPYLGEIRMFGFGRAPIGWQACDGTVLSIAENDALFNLIGTTYGGDGISTFAVPDLQSRVPIHQGTGLGLSPYVLGQRAGVESVTLIGNQMPQHTHTLLTTTSAATVNQPASNTLLGSLSGDTMYISDITNLQPIPLNTASIGTAGGTQPHNNLMPTLAIQFCIATSGVYPSQG
ncbi:phage tail protein [Lysobacter sp. K5869]|uniref:phage tail protein n=1 Tax=Lysobacter sp. K5869 TaxID=2820808 RepID=UPI001C061468|nr:tail fiber protein [Lysobacter sp. K5869]QWP75686.1 phage tail protein [Lysobacter sp. K5869]